MFLRSLGLRAPAAMANPRCVFHSFELTQNTALPQVFFYRIFALRFWMWLQFYPKTISNWTFIAFLCNYFDYRLKQFCCHCVFRCSLIRQGAAKGKMTLKIQTTNPTNLHESDWQIAPHGTRRTQNILDEWSGGGNADSIPTVTNKGFSFQHILLTHKALSFKTHPPRLFVLFHPTLASQIRTLLFGLALCERLP